jgi:octaprenyl-diphosphate synthase
MSLVCEALGGGDAALPLTPLVELSHNASLIHDDIEDHSLERRGSPAVHLLYGAGMAINGGSFLYFAGLACIEAWTAPVELQQRVYSSWGAYMRRLHLGQALDITWHREGSGVKLPGRGDYALMCRLKTGSLAALAAVLGVLAAPGALSLDRPLGDAAEKLGLGFQILDDVKNLSTGNPGKKRGDDIVEGKRSLPLLIYLGERGGSRPLVERCFAAARREGIAAPEVEELIAAMTDSGAVEEARLQGLLLVGEAREAMTAALDLVPAAGSAVEARRLLAALPDLISGGS